MLYNMYLHVHSTKDVVLNERIIASRERMMGGSNPYPLSVSGKLVIARNIAKQYKLTMWAV